MGLKIFEAEDGLVEVEYFQRGAVFRDEKGKLAVIPINRFRDGFLMNWNQPCLRCRHGTLKRITVTENEVILACTACTEALRYAAIDAIRSRKQP